MQKMGVTDTADIQKESYMSFCDLSLCLSFRNMIRGATQGMWKWNKHEDKIPHISTETEPLDIADFLQCIGFQGKYLLNA